MQPDLPIGCKCKLNRYGFTGDGSIAEIEYTVEVMEVRGSRVKVRFTDGSLDWVNLRDLRRESK